MGKILNEKDYMRSCDLALVVTISLFFPIEIIERDNNRKAYFLFRKDTKGFEETLRQYWSRELRVEPQAFFGQLKVIKARIYSEDNN